MFPFVNAINAVGWFHLGYFGLILPFSAVIKARQFANAEKPLPNRLLQFKRTAATLVMFGAASVLVAHFQRIELFPRALPPWRAIGAGLLMFVLAVAAMRPRWRRAVERGLRVVYLFMPANATERAWWIIVAVLAGVTEEITWRGVQAGLAYKAIGNIGIVMLFCAASFAIGHIIQGWRSAAVISVFALAFHLLVWLSGSLYVAMAVHIAYDITAGISYGRLGRELGYRPDAPADPAAPAELTLGFDE